MQRRKGQEIVPIETTDGYYQVKLCKNGNEKSVRIHQLVGQHFLKKPCDYDRYNYEINHIDCDRKNNHDWNLEWMTHGDNIQYSIDKGNHVCTKNLFGKNNPNYGNHVLSEIYRKNPQLAIEKLSRPGSQNGRARKIFLYDCNETFIATFDWIGGCIEFLKQNNYSNLSEETIRNKIRHAVKNKELFLNCYFKYA